MRAFIIPAAIAALIAGAPLAMAAQMTTGHVKAFDAKTNTLTLKNGTAYMLPVGFKDPGLKAGSKVQVSWDMQGGKHEASAVKIVK